VKHRSKEKKLRCISGIEGDAKPFGNRKPLGVAEISKTESPLGNQFVALLLPEQAYANGSTTA